HGEMVSMTDHDNSQGEPTMEEILASIRRIISEDNEESEGAASKTAKAEGKDAGPPQESGKDDADRREAEVLELSPAQMVQEDKAAPANEPKPNGLDKEASESPSASSGEAKREESAPGPAESAGHSGSTPRPVQSSGEVEETLLSPEVATAAAAAFGALSKDVSVSRGKKTRSLEELVQEMMKPMLKEWLDENLPPLVEEVVEREVRRLSHRRVRR
ncbi:MAG: DUF2497 domain-containing protein, partial [Alphaproteobacteria bacterium]